MGHRFIVIGIDTEVGKTVVSAILTQALNGKYWKPIQCGYERDRDWIDRMVSHKQCSIEERYWLKTPCSPHLAARMEQKQILSSDFTLPDCSSHLIIEGAGGILAPINEKENWIDIASSWDVKWILVHRHYLGSLNHFQLTVDYLIQRKFPLLGIVFNGTGDLQTEEMLIRKSKSQCLGRLIWDRPLTRQMIEKKAKEWQPILAKVLGC